MNNQRMHDDVPLLEELVEFLNREVPGPEAAIEGFPLSGEKAGTGGGE